MPPEYWHDELRRMHHHRSARYAAANPRPGPAVPIPRPWNDEAIELYDAIGLCDRSGHHSLLVQLWTLHGLDFACRVLSDAYR
jgi:hypothetical protein